MESLELVEQVGPRLIAGPVLPVVHPFALQDFSLDRSEHAVYLQAAERPWRGEDTPHGHH